MSNETTNTAVPKLRFPEFREAGEWIEKPLGELGSVLMCKRIFAEETNEFSGIPFFKIGTLGGRPDAFISEDLFEEYKAKYNFPRKGEILITCSGTVGKSLPYDGENAYYQDSNIVWIDNPNLEISNELLSYLIAGVDWGELNSTTIKRIYGDDLRKLVVAFPKAKKEQQKIAATLSSLDDLLTAQSAKLAALQAHKRGLMQGLFPAEGETVPKLRFPEFQEAAEWEEKPLKAYLELLTDFEANGSFADVKKNVQVSDKPDFAWYVRATDLENGTDLEKVKYVDRHSYNFLRKTSLHGGELLIAKRGEIGKLFFFEMKENTPATVAPNLYLLKMNEKAVPKFFFYFFSNKAGNQALKRLNASSTIGALYKDDVKNIRLCAPSLGEQQKITDCLSFLDNRITAQSQKIESLKLHKKGLMQGLFPAAAE